VAVDQALEEAPPTTKSHVHIAEEVLQVQVDVPYREPEPHRDHWQVAVQEEVQEAHVVQEQVHVVALHPQALAIALTGPTVRDQELQVRIFLPS
jgi:hypothetical protein